MKNKTNLLFAVVMMFSVLLVPSCSSSKGHITSFEDLSSDYEKRIIGNLNQYAVMSIAGLLPAPTVGIVHHSVPRRKASSFIGFSGEDKSYRVNAVFEPGGTAPNVVADVRDAIDELKIKISDEITAIIARRAAIASGDATRITAAETKLAAARKDVQKAHSEVSMRLKTANILVYRWAVKKEKSGSLGLGTILGLSGSSESFTEGYAVVNGLRIETLYLGKQWKSIWDHPNEDGDNKIVTYQIFAKDIAYSASESEIKQAAGRIEASADQLKNAGETLSKLDKVEIEFALSRISSLSNLGRLSAVKWTTTPVTGKISQIDLSKHDNWLPFFSVSTKFNALDGIDFENKSN